MATVVNLSKVFGNEDKTIKFATRYLKTTHCDLFFADSIIIVEGAAERMLLPRFIKNKYPELTARYISILEVGGSHAHTLRSIIEALDIPTLIVTDIDPCDPNDNNKAKFPEMNKEYKTNNDTLKSWIPGIESFDDLIKLKPEKKFSSNNKVHVVYQSPFSIKYKSKDEEILPYTFEDSLFFTNFDTFKTIEGYGFIKKFKELANKQVDIIELRKSSYGEVKDNNNSKAKFALDLLYSEESDKIEPPVYINEGLEWLKSQLETNKKGKK